MDYFPSALPMPSDTCFEYYLQLEPGEYFWQDDYDTQDEVFWVSIAALYPEDIFVQFPWGWKTRPWSWMDDAVSIKFYEEYLPGMVLDPGDIAPIQDDTFGPMESYDVAFELDTDPNYVKWEQPFTGIREWPHYEDANSWAIEDSATGEISIMQMVADDWPCDSNTPINALVWWGSYIVTKPVLIVSPRQQSRTTSSWESGQTFRRELTCNTATPDSKSGRTMLIITTRYWSGLTRFRKVCLARVSRYSVTRCVYQIQTGSIRT